jgi:4-diphosphocytidyl-2-C-methyl-D-erythritol kinase
MIVFPNAKINIGLNITAKRADGYHDIETVFYPIGISDILEIVVNSQADTDVFTFSGIPIPGNDEDNICLHALAHLRKRYRIPSLNIHLHKITPIGAGLGGGSSDAAFFIKAINAMFDLQVMEQEQIELSRRLGSDCAFFILNKPVFAKGKGDEFTLIDLSLKDYYLVLLNPQIHISTKEAYDGVHPARAKVNLKEALNLAGINDWKTLVENDFEKSIFLKHPIIREIKDGLYQNGAIYAAMSGSGSSVYGIFKEKPILKEGLATYLCWQGKMN